MGLIDNKNVIHKRMMVDSHRIKCRRAIIICVSSLEAKQLAQRLSQTKVMNRCICAVVVENLISDLSLFEKQVIKFGDNRSQHQLLYVSDLSRSRGPSGLTQFLKEKFSPFGTILSILVCSDDDGYASPEGVIKFAYLSEAFAAELAFDQFVVGKERLTVTTHHNILLSECDLRVRLRDAQWYSNADNNESSESLFHSFNSSNKLNSLASFNNNYYSVENSINNLHTSHSTSGNDNSMQDALEDTLPAFSQYNIQGNSLEDDFDRAVLLEKKKMHIGKQNISNTVSSSRENSWHSNDNSYAVNSNNCTITNSPQQDNICASDTALTSTRIINHVDKSKSRTTRKNIILDNLLPVNKKTCKNASDSGSFVTCSSPIPNSNNLFFSPKKSSYKSLNSQESNSILECQSIVSSSCKLLSSPIEGNLVNDTEITESSLPKHSKKRRKKFTPSQKLCLKNQRTGLSQGSVLNTSTQISDSGSSYQENSQKCKQIILRKNNLDLCVSDCKNTESLHSCKVADWLSHLPVPVIKEEKLFPNDKISVQDSKNIESSEPSKVDRLSHLPSTGVELSEAADQLPDLQTTLEDGNFSSKKKDGRHSRNIFTEKKKLLRSRISVHRTPALKTMTSNHKYLHPDNCSVENENPNKISIISSDCNDPILLTDDYNSPLQMWLKQELVSSVNNSAFESKETSKSIIVCATKTKDIIMSVGCSHMTCDTCYPESTDLLLGYS